MIVQAQKIDNQNQVTNNQNKVNSSDNKPKVTFTDIPAKKTVPVSTTTTTTIKTVTTSTTTTTTTTSKPQTDVTDNNSNSKPIETKSNDNNNIQKSSDKQVDDKTTESKVVDNKSTQIENKSVDNKTTEAKQNDNKQTQPNSSKIGVTALDNGTTTTGSKILASSDNTIKSLSQLSSFGVSSDTINLIKSCNPSNITIHEFDTAEVLAGGKAPAGYIPVEVNGSEVTYEAPTGTVTFNIPKGTKVPAGVKDLGNGLYSVTFKNNTKPVKVPANINTTDKVTKVINYNITVTVKDSDGKVISKEVIKANTGKDFKLPEIKLPKGYTEVAETINGQPSKDGVYTAPSDPSKGVNIVITVKEDASAKAHQTVTDNKYSKPTNSESPKENKPVNKQENNKKSTTSEQGKTEQVNKDQSKDVKENNETNNKTTDSKIVVEVLANGKTVLSTKTFAGKPGEIAHLDTPDYKGYTLTDITVNGKLVNCVPTKFDNGMQLVIYHVANKSGKINVKILNENGKQVGEQTLTGFLGTNANMSNLKLPKGYRISTIVSNGEVVDSVPYKEGTQNIIVNLEPNKESTVVVQFVGKDGKKLKNDYIVEGLTGKVLKLNDNLLPVGYKVVGITVNGKSVESVPTVFPGENEKIVITMEKLGTTNNTDNKTEATKGSVNSTATGKTAVSHSISSDNSSQGTKEESNNNNNTTQDVNGTTQNTNSTTTSNRGDFETPSHTITDGDEGILGMNKVDTSTPSITPAGVSKATLIHTGLNTSNKDLEGAISLLEAISVGMALLLKSKR